jgi:hypothetical protein
VAVFFYWLAGAVISYIGIKSIFYDPKSNYGSGNGDVLFFPILIGSFIVGTALKSYIEEERKESTAYIELQNKKNNDLNKGRPQTPRATPRLSRIGCCDENVSRNVIGRAC